MKEKFKTKKNKPFFVAIVMLVVSAIVITTASFAWFTLGRNGGVKAMDVKISSKEGIQISGNTQAFTTFIEKADLDGTGTSDFKAYDGNTNKFPEVIAPSSSNFNFSTGSLPAFFTGGIEELADGTQQVETVAVTTANGRDYETGYSSSTFNVFDVFVKYEGDQDEFTVSMKDSKIEVKTDTDGTSADANVEKAMRLGFVNLGTVTSDANAGSTYNSNVSRIFAPGRVDGSARTVSPIGSTGVATSISGSVITSGSVLSSYPSDVVASSGADATMTLAKGINRVRVYVWMEGQDALCTDALESQLTSVTINFEMA